MSLTEEEKRRIEEEERQKMSSPPKLCPNCKMEVHSEAKTCPHCRKDLRGWSSYKGTGMGGCLIVVFIILGLITFPFGILFWILAALLLIGSKIGK